MTIEPIKILAEGSYKRFMTILLPNGNVYTITIPDKVYKDLKELGVPTAQKLRWQKKI